MSLAAAPAPVEDNPKDRVKAYFDAGDVASGRIALKQEIERDLSLATAQWALQFREALNEKGYLTPFKLAILRSYTVEPLLPLLEASALIYDVDLQIWTGEFNSYAQEILMPSGPLFEEDFDGVYLGILSRDLCPALWSGQAFLDEDAGTAELEKAQSLLASCIQNFRQKSSAPLVVQNFEPIPFSPRANGFASANTQAFTVLNQQLDALCADTQSVYTSDYAGLVSYYGYENWFDEKKWRQASQNVSAQHLPDFAKSLLHYITPLAMAPAKVIVTDLDHTLWHGVIGEDGVEGIKISDKGKTGGHKKYQETLKQLQRDGFVLAVSSKNSEEDALNGIENHPDMVLKKEDFAVIKANWDSKAENIQAIAKELNVGLESVIFVDDNPVERETVLRTCPQVTVINLPEEPKLYSSALLDCARLSRLLVANEDRQKAQMYAAENKRKDAMQGAGDLTSFLHDLDMKVDLAGVGKETLARAAQLTQKTNQFNVTTLRYTEADIQAMIDADDYRTYISKAYDRFGDHGWINMSLVKIDGENAWFDTFLMSCRVLGRGVESATLSYITADLKEAGVKTLHAAILPTKKNEPVRDVFEKHGFSESDNLALAQFDERFNNQDASCWHLDLGSDDLPQTPEWISFQKL